MVYVLNVQKNSLKSERRDSQAKSRLKIQLLAKINANKAPYVKPTDVTDP